VILVGDMGVGKTNLVSRFIKNEIPKKSSPTIGVEYATKNITLESGWTIKAQIWDTAGQEKYRAITEAHFRKAIGAVIVYDITKEESLISVKKWIEDIREKAQPEIVIIMVGNKLDLAEQDPSERKVTRESAASFAK
jgi:small GTP-binding protein